MKRGRAKAVVVVLILGVFLLASSQEALAGNRNRGQGHGRSHPYQGKKVKFNRPPHRVVVDRSDFYYFAGFFFELFDRDYVIVTAPVGAVVTSLPRGHKRVMLNGITYYYYNDVYYRRQPHGYVVVEDPVYYIPQIPSEVKVVTPPQYVENTQDSFVVHVPNNSGSYTPVVIKRSGDGFIGPQGEFYPDFPRVDQLKTIYCG